MYRLVGNVVASTHMLARRPVHLSAAEEVDMEPPHRLLTVGALVDNQPVAVLAETLFARHLRGYEHEVTDQGLFVLIYVTNAYAGERREINLPFREALKGGGVAVPPMGFLGMMRM
jgi:hypothetical protein